MREILFKAKRLDNGEWVEGYICKHPSAVQIGDCSPWYIHVPPVDPDDNGGTYNVDPETVCQFTGLTDKNGKRVFENDIIKDCFGGVHRVEYGHWNCGCCYDVYGFIFKEESGIPDEIPDAPGYGYFLETRLDYSEVIGNIHDKED